MQIDRYERIFLYSSAVILAVFFSAVIFSVAETGIHLPTKADAINPNEVRSTAPFDDPGVFQTGPNSFDVVIIAEAWGYTPNQITVPAGAEVTFKVTSVDVIHGFMIPNTRVNAMLIPGHVTEVTYEFEEAGEHSVVCHEFCGIGHHTMFATVEVTG